MTVFKIILSIVYFFPGYFKLRGAEPISEQFEEFGFSPRTMRIVGILEVAAAIGIHIDGLSLWSAAGMCLMMVVAIYNHVKVKHPWKMSVPAFVVSAASLAYVVMMT